MCLSFLFSALSSLFLLTTFTGRGPLWFPGLSTPAVPLQSAHLTLISSNQYQRLSPTHPLLNPHGEFLLGFWETLFSRFINVVFSWIWGSRTSAAALSFSWLAVCLYFRCPTSLSSTSQTGSLRSSMTRQSPAVVVLHFWKCSNTCTH